MLPQVVNIARLTGHGGPIYGLQAGRQIHTFFSCGSDRTVAEWDLRALKPIGFSIRLDHGAYSICHVKEEYVLLIGNAVGGIHVVDLAAMSEVWLLQNHTQPVFDMLHVPHLHLLISAAADGTLCTTDTRTWQCTRVIRLCTAKIRGLALSPDATEVAVACGDGAVRLFRTADMARVGELCAAKASVNALAYLPDGNSLVCGDKDAHMHVWDLRTGLLQQSLAAHNYAIYHLALSPDSRLLASASRDRTVKLWDTATLQPVRRMDQRKYGGHTHSVNRLLWVDDHRLLSTGDDRTIILWDIEY